VAYVYDAKCGLDDGKGTGTGTGDGIDDPNNPYWDDIPGCSILANAVDGQAIASGVPYPVGGLTVTFTNMLASGISSVSAFTGYNTVILYEICDIATLGGLQTAVKNYLTQGDGKVVIYDADDCAPNGGGTASYSWFLFPFKSSNPGPKGWTGTVTWIEPENSPATLTQDLTMTLGDNASTDAIGDSNTFTAYANGWCAAENGTNGFDVTGVQIAYAETPAHGLVIYDGNDNWYTDRYNAWDQQVFDNIIEQPFNNSSLPCSNSVVPPQKLVAPDPTPTGEISIGQSINLTAKPSGGTPPYTIQWYSSPSFTCSPSTLVGAGTTLMVAPITNTYYYYVVKDSTGASAVSSCDLIAVDPSLLAGAITPTGEISLGQNVTLIAHPSEGVPPYTYQWFEGPYSNCSADDLIANSNSSTYTATGLTVGTYFCYRVSDSSIAGPENATSVADYISVDPALSAVLITPLNPIIDPGQAVVLTASVSGGVPPYSYQWFTASSSSCVLTPSDVIHGQTFSTYYAAPTSTTYYGVKVTDAAIGEPPENNTSCTQVRVSSASAGNITPVDPNISLEQGILLIANPSGGAPPYSYQWYSGSSPICSSDTAIPGATGSTYLASPWASTYYCYALGDSSGGRPPQTVWSATDWVTVYPPLFAGMITPVDPTIFLGQSITLTANPSGGVPPYSYQWYSGSPPSCANLTLIPGANNSTYTATPTSSTAYAYTLDDNASGEPPENASFLCDLVTVQSTPCNYTVTFVETGLKAARTWSVTLNGVTMSATTSSKGAGTAITFTGVCTGTWSFNVTAPLGYAANPPSGNVTIPFGLPPGNEVYQLIVFSGIVCSYAVTFVEFDLSVGAKWAVSLNGVLKSGIVTASKTTITFTGKSCGSYSFIVKSPHGYMAHPSSGTVTVPVGATSKTEYQLIVFQDPATRHATPSPSYERLLDQWSSGGVSVLIGVAMAAATIGVVVIGLMRYRRPPGRGAPPGLPLAPPPVP
jgi:hypothetical protein